MRIICFIFFQLCMNGLMSQTTFMTTEGSVKAYLEEGLLQAYSIPYAAPPINDLRWKEPKQPAQHEAVWDGKNHSDMSAQIRTKVIGGTAPFGTVVGSEDCLYLDIVTHENRATVRPVIVWIHGGSNIAGTKSDEVYEAHSLARNTDAVVVKVNYRLGIFGSFYHPELHENDTVSASGNYTLLDLVAALKWIQANIESFGGDPTNVTLVGESAGCINIWSLLCSPLSNGLFHKAVCLSGLPNIQSAKKAYKYDEEIIQKLFIKQGKAADKKAAGKLLKNLPSDSLASFLYGLSTSEILLATKGFSHHFIADGYTLKESGFSTMKKDNVVQMPIIVSMTGEEASYFGVEKALGLTSEELWEIINTNENIQDIEKFVSSDKYNKYRKKVTRQSCLLHKLVELYLKKYERSNSEIYRLQFEATPGKSPWKEVFMATHASDLIYLFDKRSFNAPHFFTFLEPEDQALFEKQVKQYHAYLKNFIRTGKPGTVNGLEWPVWNKKDSDVIHLKTDHFQLGE
ncbi:MAG: carboxylesterase family protein [Flavobacteriales bacterium]|nr:carboxylesterase family protein [Flavobacteriales bacterium]